MNNEALKARIIARHDEIMNKARELFPSFRTAAPCNVYFFTTGKAAGLAHGDMRIGYNIHVFAQDAERFIASTIPHEIAHLVCMHSRTDMGHGATWKRVCRMLGGNAQRCYSGEGVTHSMARKRKQYEYRATCGKVIMVSDVMHGKIQRGATNYSLKASRGKLLAAGFTGQTA